MPSTMMSTIASAIDLMSSTRNGGDAIWARALIAASSIGESPQSGQPGYMARMRGHDNSDQLAAALLRWLAQAGRPTGAVLFGRSSATASRRGERSAQWTFL